MSEQRCKGVDGKGRKADGTPCEAPFVDESGYCPAHRPGGTADMRERGRKGAEATRRKLKGRGTVKADEVPPPPETMADAAKWASWIPFAVTTGKLDPKIGDVAVRAIREFRGAYEKAALEAEIQELRAKVAAMKGDGADGD